MLRCKYMDFNRFQYLLWVIRKVLIPGRELKQIKIQIKSVDKRLQNLLFGLDIKL